MAIKWLGDALLGACKDHLKKLLGIALLALAATAWKLTGHPFPSSVDDALGQFELFLAWAKQSVIEHPVNVSSWLAIIVAVFVLIYLLIRANKKLRDAIGAQDNVSDFQTLIDELGIAGRWPHAKITSDANGGASWSEMCADIARTDNTFVYILGANGEDTFGAPHSPLYGAIGNFSGSVRVVLLDPTGTETAARARAVNVGLKDYKKSITKSRMRLLTLKRQGKPIEGKFYSGRPNWKMIITNKRAWIQYYGTASHVADSPVFVFYNSASRYSFYAIFHAEFTRIWERCDKPMPLT